MKNKHVKQMIADHCTHHVGGGAVKFRWFSPFGRSILLASYNGDEIQTKWGKPRSKTAEQLKASK